MKSVLRWHAIGFSRWLWFSLGTPFAELRVVPREFERWRRPMASPRLDGKARGPVGNGDGAFVWASARARADV